jgi:serine-type D-Ala-D-Ala carboxypeptidase (penicillin-binding protein 5/6)
MTDRPGYKVFYPSPVTYERLSACGTLLTGLVLLMLKTHCFLLKFLLLAALLIAAPLASGQTKPPKARPVPEKPQKPVAAPYTVAREPYLGAIVLDANDGSVLFEKDADAMGHPASVLKLMLLLISMEQVQAGKLKLTDPVTVGPAAVGSEGADLKLKVGEVFTVEELLYACMMHSANDAANCLAERLGGSLAGYVEMSNARAQTLGMVNSKFYSASGLGPKDPVGPYDITTARDLTLLCREILKHPQALVFTAAQKRVFRPKAPTKQRIQMETHNYILDMVPGCDGLKTGYIRAAGYCIAGTAKRGERRVITVILGASSEKSRNKQAAEFLKQGLEKAASGGAAR